MRVKIKFKFPWLSEIVGGALFGREKEMIFWKINLRGWRDMVEFSAERMVKIEEREKSNSHRIDKLEGLADAIYRQNENIARLVEKLEATNSALAAQEARLSEIEKLPRERGEAVFSSGITALASAIAGALVTMLFG
jgi:hypothetical protein